MQRCRFVSLVILALVGALSTASARNLSDALPGLFSGGNTGSGVALQIGVGSSVPLSSVLTGVSGSLSNSIGSFRGEVPVVSGSAGFTYQFDPRLDLFVRTTESLGPLFSERAQTLGRGKFAVSVSYTHAGFDTLEGTNLDSLSLAVPVGAILQKDHRIGNLFPGIGDDVVTVALDLGIKTDTVMLAFMYGVTDRLDVGVALPLVRVEMNASPATATISDINQNDRPSGSLNRLSFLSSNGRPTNTVSDSFDESKFGIGDVYLRGKYRVFESSFADVAGALTVTLPTGGADDFLGYHDVTATPLLVVSKTFGFLEPHINGGYAYRSSKDVAQAVWAAGADMRLLPWLTVAPDFLGFHDVDRKGPIKDDVIQYSFGFKVNPWRQLVWGVNFQFPMNHEGLRADVIYTTQLEYDF